MDDDAVMLARIVAFLESIGLPPRTGPLGGPTVLPGVTIEHGVLVVDPVHLVSVGDVLHEAGHLAVVPSSERALLHVRAGNDGGTEMAAIAWSYAAARHLGVPAAVLFHSDGYRGQNEALIENFAAGRYVGVPILVWRGLTSTTDYPVMTRWLTD